MKNNQVELSVLVPARNEEFLARTIQDLLEHSKGNTEIIAVLDGYLPDPPLQPDPRITIIYNPVSVGQRAASNQAAKLAKGKYVMKVDAHCAFDDGFDVKMIDAFKETGDNVTIIPVMRNLHAFDWVCPDGHRRYQSPSGLCETCSKPTTKDVVWIPKKSPATHSFRFDKTMHFQYWGEWSKTQTGDLRETMSIQGSCFMLTKEKYFELDICSEDFNSWGQQGVEVACKTWLSGGRVIVNMRTWFAHMFRTRGGDFGFPYSNPQVKVNENRELSRELFQKDKWPKATRTFQWILDKFNPPKWGISKGAIFYTDNQLDEKIAKPIRDQLL
ncbi:MAG: glycosyltransferase family 2 protein, partial [Patescibacteria group bacterium]